ncbi:hypoxanthine phosphoribosyltransferase [Mycoplasma tauri]|uniref:hypoxanthine phosphoribosyltransferase n=1 Tax=Mycoplasma tauri TaxID=547987 RepID=UPI001967E144|nr:hypoxanthine phosphoribosyltransferase [Mycoplasma tauri]MBZ4203495.1 hypoxanthine phosphoribosyltransferase [Mycoplasma tauri]MBZ4212465.1 hypoxanthine phosphoribosyltransferase [Mycoplasma tauri]MBZ4218108.1 hypoxanthine phosphoribosyltransferase [Mycoplasma tauri]QSB07803.1 hypoxanthine phosphoribosyltransferase [Mycoplasma tauri]
MQINNDDKLIDRRITKVVFTREKLEKKIKELADWVNETYADSKDLIIVGLLKGCVPFLAQLIKDVTVDHKLDFITASSYAGSSKSSGNVKIVMDLVEEISNRDVLIVEDIIDSGITLSKIRDILLTRNPKSIKILTLLDKPYYRKVDIKVDKYGFEAPAEFLVGFGLDYEEKLRNLPYIGVFDKKYL